MMGDPLGSSSLVSSQKQNREGVIGAQNGQNRAMVESSSGCGGKLGRDVTKTEPIYSNQNQTDDQ